MSCPHCGSDLISEAAAGRCPQCGRTVGAGAFEATPQPGPAASSPERAVATLLDAVKSTVNTGKAGGPPLTGLLPEAQTRAFRIYGKSMGSWLGRQSGQVPFDGAATGGSGTSGSGSGPVVGGPGEVPAYPGPDTAFLGLAKQCSGCGVDYHDLEVSVRRTGSLTYVVLDSLQVDSTTQDCGFSTDGWFNEDPDGSAPAGPDEASGEGSVGIHGSTGSVMSGPIEAGADPSGACVTEKGTAAWDGHCVTYSTTHAPKVDWVDDTSGKGCLGDELGDSGLSLADFGVTEVHLVVSQERGGWVIDPVATILDYGRTALGHLGDPKVQAAIDGGH